MIRVLLSAFLLAAVTACAPPLAKRDAPIKTLAIASAFGERIEMKFVGVIVPNNTESQADVDWQIDQHVKARAAAELAGRYQLREVPYDSRQFFIDVKKLGASLASDPEIIAEIKKVIPANTADAVLVFLPHRFADRIGRSYELLSGPGFYGRTLLGMGKRAAYFSYQAVLLDGATMQPLAVGFARLPQPAMFGLPDLPYRDVDARWRDTYAEIPPAERELLRRGVFALFDESLPALLEKLGLR
jgi:hypothetical protein